ncbi:hypothetical protein HZ994_11695 [Akkermansiaceae bacterium]|nr:hypothetical protein HZ994_11695 [Akkermansiaceae bacterium]
MKQTTHAAIAAIILVAGFPQAGAQNTAEGYTNFIRQVQLPYEPDRITRDVYVNSTGEQLSPLEINPGGARFELHTVKATPLTSYLLDTKYVGTYVPMAEISIRTEDPYTQIPRTRADRPFYVDINISGLLNGASDPVASKSVKLLRHVQSYGTGDGTAINRSQATLLSQSTVNQNGLMTLTYALSSVPGADRSKIRGEERFSVFTHADYQAPESQLASMFVQVWPVASGTISGISSGQTIQFTAPTLTLSINDIYPDSQVYAQAYRGNRRDDGFVGTILPGSAVIVKETVPQSRLLSVSNWDYVITDDGIWTVELLTSTPFGIDRLSWVSFSVDRTITVNASVTTSE